MNKLMSQDKGFTLIEVIVSLMLMGFLAVIAGFGLAKIAEGYVVARQNTESIQKAHVAMARIVKELSAVTGSGSLFIDANATGVTYTRSDGTVTNTIQRAGSTVTLGSTLLDNVTAFALKYYDGANPAAQITLPADYWKMRRVDIDLTANGVNNQTSVAVQSSYF